MHSYQLGTTVTWLSRVKNQCTVSLYCRILELQSKCAPAFEFRTPAPSESMDTVDCLLYVYKFAFLAWLGLLGLMWLSVRIWDLVSPESKWYLLSDTLTHSHRSRWRDRILSHIIIHLHHQRRATTRDSEVSYNFFLSTTTITSSSYGDSTASWRGLLNTSDMCRVVMHEIVFIVQHMEHTIQTTRLSTL